MIGIDVVSIARMKRILDGAIGNRFIDRVLRDSEKSLFQTIATEGKPEFLARCFAAKEAVIKASAGRLDLTQLDMITVLFAAKGQQMAVDRERNSFLISTDSTGDYAIAVAIERDSSEREIELHLY